MSTSFTVAAFAALVASIAVIAVMTGVGALWFLYYTSTQQELARLRYEAQLLQATPRPVGPDPFSGEIGDTLNSRRAPPPMGRPVGGLGRGMIDASRLHTPDEQGTEPFDAAFGTPEWTEEEGATEIFSAAHAEEFAEYFEDDATSARNNG